MSKVLFETLAELVADIKEGDSRAAYSVGYRGKDFYALAASEEEAAGEVAKSLGMQVGLVPLDLIVSAARRLAMQGSAAYAGVAGGGMGTASPAPAAEFTFSRDVFEKMAVADLKEYAGKNGVEIPGKGKSAIIDAIEAYWKAKNDPAQAKLPLGDGDAPAPEKKAD